jgi:hypothetical protein
MRELAKLEPNNKTAAAATQKLLKELGNQESKENKKHSVFGK